MVHQEIDLVVLGSIAASRLHEPQVATLMGATSRGLFILLPSGWVIYLTPESDHGPLTLNYSPQASDLPPQQSGAPVQIFTDRIVFPAANLQFLSGKARTWEVPEIPGLCLSPSQRAQRLVEVAAHAQDQGRTSVVSALLPALLGQATRSKVEDSDLFTRLLNLESALMDSNKANLVEAIQPFLGLGGGLTPSGDDLVAGLLFALARWGHELSPDLEVEAVGREILPLAYRTTTTLAANLIDCALRNQANQRLLLALDGIMCGDPDPATCAQLLAGWGNTSGLDALVGMALAVRLQRG